MKAPSLILSCLLFILIIQSCRKEEQSFSDKSDWPGPQALATSHCWGDGVSLYCGDVPCFANESIFETVLNCLQQHYDHYNNLFQSHFSSLSDSAFNDTADALGFNDEAPLDSFENNYSYASLRTYTNSLENAWLNNSVLDTATDPEDENPFADDPVMSTLFSSHGEVMK